MHTESYIFLPVTVRWIWFIDIYVPGEIHSMGSFFLQIIECVCFSYICVFSHLVVAIIFGRCHVVRAAETFKGCLCGIYSLNIEHHFEAKKKTTTHTHKHRMNASKEKFILIIVLQLISFLICLFSNVPNFATIHNSLSERCIARMALLLGKKIDDAGIALVHCNVMCCMLWCSVMGCSALLCGTML